MLYVEFPQVQYIDLGQIIVYVLKAVAIVTI